jgi:hypothetical protein
MFGAHRHFSEFEHAVEPAQDDHRQYDEPVLRWPTRPLSRLAISKLCPHCLVVVGKQASPFLTP